VGGSKKDLLEKKHPLNASLRGRERQWSRTSGDSKFEKHKWPPEGGQEGGSEGQKSQKCWENRPHGGGILNSNK